MSHTEKKLYVGTQNDMLYLIDQPPSPAPIDFPHEGYGAKAVAKIFGGDYQEESENARRLVACWNACESVSTEQLECDNPTFVRMLLERQTLKQERAALKSENEQLRKAAEALLEFLEQLNPNMGNWLNENTFMHLKHSLRAALNREES